MALRFFLRDANLEPCTGGVKDGDLSKTQGSPSADFLCRVNDTAFVEGCRLTVDIGSDTWADGSHSLKLDVSSVVGSVEYRFRLERLDGSCVSQAQSANSSLFTTAGLKSFSLSLTGGTGNRLVLFLESRRTGSHGNVDVNLSVQNPSSYVDTPFTAGAASALTRQNAEDLSGTFADVTTRGWAGNRLLGETLPALTDTLTRLWVGARTVVEDISGTFVDAVTRVVGRIRVLTEDVSGTFGDTVDRLTTYLRTVTEDISGTFVDVLTKIFTPAGGLVRTLTEDVSASFVDAVDRLVVYQRSTAEDVSSSFVDTVTRIGVYLRTVTEDVSSAFSDSVARLVAYGRGVVEDFSSSFVDATTRGVSYLRNLTEDFSGAFVDALTRVKSGVTNFVRTVTQDLSSSFSDLVTRLAKYRRRS